MRARCYSTEDGVWLTVDRYWIKQGSYVYALCRPTLLSDASGNLACQGPDCCAQTISQSKSLNPCDGDWTSYSNPAETQSSLSNECASKGSCTAIQASLVFILRQCSNMCGRARNGKGSYQSGELLTNYALAVCCGGKLCEVLMCDSKTRPVTDPCVRKCLFTHELRHSKQNYYDCGGPINPPASISNKEGWTECDAYSVQAQCLFDAAASKKCSFINDESLGFKQALAACLKSAKF